MSRRLNRDNRSKVRNIPRRINALNRWADTFRNPERAIFSEDEHYWNFKIPVAINLIQGKYSTVKTKASCAQALINACSNLIAATADMYYSPRITAVICLPDMFTSEVCLYRSEDYYQSFITERRSDNDAYALIKDRSLAAEWGLILPENVQELGITFEYYGSEDFDEWFTGERWYYGQVI
ncbi:DUF3916 domain-containing protein [Yersinia intermedia]|uniref:DUF3916 domain-containing protein n=1 Tax=Yersinia intermedia TaxID=631 RepID=UPI001CFCC05D|nr:DUF3916 domain-containing protein [Yersinia intermedia]MCB5311930.1 DUF3916 domain-containing protein [Yersinia intermedia]MCB5325345.1 DUF3916 domain-containing protein [Yersinia intermedia]